MNVLVKSYRRIGGPLKTVVSPRSPHLSMGDNLEATERESSPAPTPYLHLHLVCSLTTPKAHEAEAGGSRWISSKGLKTLPQLAPQGHGNSLPSCEGLMQMINSHSDFKMGMTFFNNPASIVGSHHFHSRGYCTFMVSNLQCRDILWRLG